MSLTPSPKPAAVAVETGNGNCNANANQANVTDVDVENPRYFQNAVNVKDVSTSTTTVMAMITTQRKKCLLYLTIMLLFVGCGCGLGAALGWALGIIPPGSAAATSIPIPPPSTASKKEEQEEDQKGGSSTALGITPTDSTESTSIASPGPAPSSTFAEEEQMGGFGAASDITPTDASTAIVSPPSSTFGDTEEEEQEREGEQHQYFCGCLECIYDVWSSPACDDSASTDCFSCGSRITWLQGMAETERSACIKVSEEFPSVCGPFCNPLVCSPSPPTPAPSLPRLDEPDSSKLIWSDEFDIDGAPDPTKWTYDIGDGCSQGLCGWGNSEFQYYTDSPDNVIVENGLLRISAKRDLNWRYGREYTSARLVSRGEQAFRFGRIRLRARVNGCTAKGIWAALWMLPDAISHTGWPDGGEIDLMEYVGYKPNTFHGSAHTKEFNFKNGTQTTAEITKSETEWHIFEIDWQVDKIRFAVDKELYLEFAPNDVKNAAEWPFNENFHLIMNIAVGGDWGAMGGVDQAAFEGDGQYMEVDWVRAYSL